MKLWKIAISLAAAGALAAPFIFDTWPMVMSYWLQGPWVWELAINLAVPLAVFVGIFGLVMALPAILAVLRAIALRYWRWLRT